MAFSSIPLIVHQTWRTTDINTWKIDVVSWVEKWLEDAVLSRKAMAYFFWNDQGMRELVQKYEPQFINLYDSLTPVERSDIFRILVCKHFGGIVCGSSLLCYVFYVTYAVSSTGIWTPNLCNILPLGCIVPIWPIGQIQRLERVMDNKTGPRNENKTNAQSISFGALNQIQTHGQTSTGAWATSIQYR